jgi:hypothetical protein
VNSIAVSPLSRGPADQTGVAAGMNANLRTIGGALGGQVTTSIVSSGRRVLGYPDLAASRLAWW